LARIALLTHTRIREILPWAMLLSLSLTLLPLSAAIVVAPMQSPPTFTNWAAWQAYMAKLPTPQTGCFVANYPVAAWQGTQCATAPSETMSVGNGNDWVAKGPSGNLIGQTIGFLTTAGLTSESDSRKGAHYYSLQINSNSGFAVTYHGKSTKGWEQFLFDANGSSGSCGTTACGLVYIEYWLLGYYAAYGSCPPASQDPPGGGFGWAKSGSNCYFNTDGALTPFEAATNLSNIGFSGFAGSAASTDGDMMCSEGVACYTLTITDTVLNLYKHWTQSEFNVFGYCCRSQANFNSGTTIDVQTILEKANGASFGTAVCVKGGFTAETNNLSLGSCSTGKTYIAFPESN